MRSRSEYPLTIPWARLYRCPGPTRPARRVLLDHILVSRPLLAAFEHLEIHNETLGDELDPSLALQDPTESYHAPVVAEFELELV